MDASIDVAGIKELARQFDKLSNATAGKVLRRAASASMLPALKAIKAAAPVGKEGHKTYMGRTVAPGFLKRSIVRKSRYKNGRATVRIGVKPEAFYGVQFLEKGIKVSNRKGKPIKGYSIAARHWMTRSFISKRGEIESRFTQRMKAAIQKVTR